MIVGIFAGRCKSVEQHDVYSCRRMWKVSDVTPASRDIFICQNQTHRAVSAVSAWV